MAVLASVVVAIGAATTVSAQQTGTRPSSPPASTPVSPEAAQQLRQRIANSGLTPDQIRARLRAEGYPESLLDAYLGGASTSLDTLTDSLPARRVFDAVRELGIVDSADVATLESLGMDSLGVGTMSARGRLSRRQLDSLARDSLRRDSSRARRAAESKYARDGTTIFGLDVFQNASTQFDPNLAGPVDANYRLGPGDRLVLILTGDVEASYSLDVTREGFVVVPQVGQLYVANLTLAQLDDMLFTRLGRVYSGVRRGPEATTHFSVSVSRLRTNQVYVMGDVVRPGSYRVSAAGTAMTALYAAGGPTVFGSFRDVQVKRNNQVVAHLDVYDYLTRGDASRDPRLETGDVLFVPPRGPRVRLGGEVIRPATYEFKPGETLADLIRVAGGFSAAAARQRVQIQRVTPPAERTAGGRDRQVIDVTSDQLASGTGPAFPLEPGDVITVFGITERIRDRLNVVGNVWAPGYQGFVAGMTVSDALRRAGGVKPDTYLGQVLVSRLESDSTRRQLRASLRDTTGAVVNDFPLQEDDEIQVFSVSDFRPTRYVAISGAVHKGGRFAYRDGMTVRDLVLLARGLQESAFLSEAEVARLPEHRADGATATTFRVPLDSSYLFERAGDGAYAGPPGLPAPAGNAPEIALKPYDNVLILRQPGWQLQRTVVVAGQVKFPGKYTLKSRSERLADVITRAGGPTPEAYLDGIQFVRARDSVGRVGIDLRSVLRNPKHRDNIALQDGDSIVIPMYNPIVLVKGEVQSQVGVAYVPGQPIDYYIRAAGGPTPRADMRHAYVVQANGSVRGRRQIIPFVSQSPRPSPGSEVHVPTESAADKRDYTQLALALAQILGSLVGVIAVLKR